MTTSTHSSGVQRSGRPPGPRGWPLAGSFFAYAEDPVAFLQKLYRNHGPVSYARIAHFEVFMVNAPHLIEEVLVGRHREFFKDAATQGLIPLVGTGLLTSEGDFWRKQRKIASPPLQPKRIAGYAQTAVECSERLFRTYRDGETRDFGKDVMKLTLEIVGKTLLGVDAQRDADRIGHALDAFMDYFDRQMHSLEGLLPLWVPTPTRSRMRRGREALDAVVYSMIERCRKEDRDADHFLARLVNARDENGEAMSDEQLRDEAVTMLLAGHETSALALGFTTYLLALHPEVASRLATEVDEFLAGDPSKARALPSLKYLDAVVREGMRLYPPSYALGREALAPVELGGYRIPKGGQILISQYAVHRDPQYYDDPSAFRPERWLSPEMEKLPRYAYLPFGAGPRVCVGNHFAMMEIAIVLGLLVHHVELSLTPGFRLQLRPLITLRNEGVSVIVKRRVPRARAAAE